VARVTAALPLTEQQRERLTAALRRIYDHDVWLNVDVDPEVIGGLRVQVGDEVIDATVLSRLDEARRRLAG
jgi:F-type H+-transporting ATPase subunit delta